MAAAAVERRRGGGQRGVGIDGRAARLVSVGSGVSRLGRADSCGSAPRRMASGAAAAARRIGRSHAAGSFFFPVAACRFANRVSTGSSRSEAAPRVCHAAARAAIARYARPARAGIERSEQARFMRRRAARGGARLSCPALANAMRANSRARPPGSASGQPAGGHCAADRPLARIRSAMRCPHGVVPRTRVTNLGRFAHLSPRSLILQFLRKRYIQWSADAS
ncbi:hypothetical protein BTHA_3958 [Burkholderia thailandensis MSMB59]|nr:hypothetical protein BTHA_3958 [Burkholderia thailandensis MSMB59]